MSDQPHPNRPHPGSFRDPSGFVYQHGGGIYRQVNLSYRENYDRILSSGLYGRLVEEGRMLPHEELPAGAAPPPPGSPEPYRILKPRQLRFISHPHEWCFGQLKETALATLALQRSALERGMSLKDASADNLQWVDGKPCLIDTLSFEIYPEGEPWVAYGQFCRHFLAPLALMALIDPRLGSLLRVYRDGVPLDLASRMLGWRGRVRLSILTHVHMHAATQRRYAGRPPSAAVRGGMSRRALEGLLDTLEQGVRSLRAPRVSGQWIDYYETSSYTKEQGAQKEAAVRRFLEKLSPTMVWDLGSNTGRFSKLAAESGSAVVAFDLDPAVVERAFQELNRSGETRILPLIQDLADPSPAQGWAHSEQASLMDRGPADTVLALALVHHLCIGSNIPLNRLAPFLARLGRSLVVEFVPKTDPQVQRMLAGREDVFAGYSQEEFERIFRIHYHMDEAVPILDSSRTLYLMRRRES